MYAERVPPRMRDTTNYFFDELVRILAGGDAERPRPHVEREKRPPCSCPCPRLRALRVCLLGRRFRIRRRAHVLARAGAEDPAESALREALEPGAFARTRSRRPPVSPAWPSHAAAASPQASHGSRRASAFSKPTAPSRRSSRCGSRCRAHGARRSCAARDRPGARSPARPRRARRRRISRRPSAARCARACVALFRAAETWSARHVATSDRSADTSPVGLPGQGRVRSSMLAQPPGAAQGPACGRGRLRPPRPRLPASAQAARGRTGCGAARAPACRSRDDARRTRELQEGAGALRGGPPSDAAPLLRALRRSRSPPADAGSGPRAARAARCSPCTRTREATAELAAVAPTSAYAPRPRSIARARKRRAPGRLQAYEAVAPGSPARPGPRRRCWRSRTTTRRTLATTKRCPTTGACSRPIPKAATPTAPRWRVGWGDYRAGRFAEAAQTLERTARLRHTRR